MKKKILVILVILLGVFAVYLYSQAQKNRSRAVPEDMGGKSASSFKELPVKQERREDTGDLKLSAPVWVEE